MRWFGDFLVVFILIMNNFAMAQASSDAIEIKGNERTRSDYIENLARSCIGKLEQPALSKDEDFSKVRQCLLNAKIFAEVKIEKAENKIVIHVEEKWTLIPAPFYQSSGKTRKVGLILFETNFLGQGLTLALGGNSSNKGGGFFGFFTNPSIASTPWFQTVSIASESTTYEVIEKGETVSYSFLEKSLGGNLGLGYRFSWLNLAFQTGRVQKRYETVEGFEVRDAYSLNTYAVAMDFDRRDYKLYFSDGPYARYRTVRTYSESSSAEPFQTHEATASWQFNAMKNHAIYLMASAYNIQGGELTDTERLGAKKGFRGIEANSAFAEHYVTQSIEYQVPLHTFDKGTLTTALFVDHGLIKNRNGSIRKTEYTAGGVGVYFYLSRIAIPGFGLEWGVNNQYQKAFTSFSIGMSY